MVRRSRDRIDESGRRVTVRMPFGLMPLLAPGRCYVQGRPSHVVRHGTLGHAVIPALRSYEEVTLGDIPAAVFPDRRSRRSAQPIYRYRTPEGELFISPQELIRRLFLHDKTLAHALLRPGGLWELARYENPGFHDKFTLYFTAAMPLGSLHAHLRPRVRLDRNPSHRSAVLGERRSPHWSGWCGPLRTAEDRAFRIEFPRVFRGRRGPGSGIVSRQRKARSLSEPPLRTPCGQDGKGNAT